MEPGIYPDISDLDYHADPALSSTGAKALIECPAIYREQRDNPPVKDAFDFGHVAHRLLLGKGSEVAVYPADCLGANGAVSTTAAKDFAKTAREQGKVPIKPDDYSKAELMARKVREHPEIGGVFASGVAEMSAWAPDPDSGVMLRCRPDWLTEDREGRPVIVDYKTTTGDVHEWALAKVIADRGYHQSAAFYLDTLALAGAIDLDDATFLLVFGSKAAPHQVRAVTLPPAALDRGRELNRRAIDLFAACTETGDWTCTHPAYAVIDLPRYAYKDKDTA